MKRTFVCLFHASDCSEEVECVVERFQPEYPEMHPGEPWLYTLASYPASCKCGRPVPHADPPQAVLRAAWGLSEAEDVT